MWNLLNKCWNDNWVLCYCGCVLAAVLFVFSFHSRWQRACSTQNARKWLPCVMCIHISILHQISKRWFLFDQIHGFHTHGSSVPKPFTTLPLHSQYLHHFQTHHLLSPGRMYNSITGRFINGKTCKQISHTGHTAKLPLETLAFTLVRTFTCIDTHPHWTNHCPQICKITIQA
jgi:hypothetical protein